MPSMHDWEAFHLSIYRINILIKFIIFNNVQGWCQEEAITEGGVFKVTVKSHCSLEEGTHSETADVRTKIRNTSQIIDFLGVCVYRRRGTLLSAVDILLDKS